MVPQFRDDPGSNPGTDTHIGLFFAFYLRHCTCGEMNSDLHAWSQLSRDSIFLRVSTYECLPNRPRTRGSPRTVAQQTQSNPQYRRRTPDKDSESSLEPSSLWFLGYPGPINDHRSSSSDCNCGNKYLLERSDRSPFSNVWVPCHGLRNGLEF